MGEGVGWWRNEGVGVEGGGWWRNEGAGGEGGYDGGGVKTSGRRGEGMVEE